LNDSHLRSLIKTLTWRATGSGATLLMPELCLTSRSHKRWEFSGIDHPDLSADPARFAQYPHKVEYHFNSRGFRDQEWPNDLTNLKHSTWCLGDSFTVGMGCAIEHTWPQILQTNTGIRTINVSMDGASNEWIARHACQILHQVRPVNMIIMWSYVHRRESDRSGSDEDRRIPYSRASEQQDLENFQQCLQTVDHVRGTTNVINAAVPGYRPYTVDPQQVWQDIRDPTWPASIPAWLQDLPKEILQEIETLHQDCFVRLKQQEFFQTSLIEVEQLDFSRDQHHFDSITAQWFVDRVKPLLQQRC